MHPMEEKRQSSCGAVRCHTLHTVLLRNWFREGSHVPRSEEDSCNLLNDKQPLSNSLATLKARLRNCACQAPPDSSQDHNEQSVHPKLVRPRVEPIRHLPQGTLVSPKVGISRCLSVSWPNNKRRMIDNVHKLTFSCGTSSD